MAVWRIGMASRALLNLPPVLASWVELMTVSMALHMKRMGWLCIGARSVSLIGRFGLSLK